MFDRVVVVDWSANSVAKLGADSIWIARGDPRSGVIDSVNVATRHQAMTMLEVTCREPGRTLVGVDFSLGYPTGTSAALGLSGVPWRATWELLHDLVVDRENNSNNRFDVASALNRRVGTQRPGPFWGCPPARATTWLTSTKVPSDPLPQWRAVEARLRVDGRRPFSSWQLLGAGAVGSQSVLGIAALERLRRRLGRPMVVWPLSCGFVEPTAAIVVCEVWPSLFALAVADGRVRDDLQVSAVASALVERVRSGRLSEWFTPCPTHLDPEHVATVVAEEGWVLGV